MTEFRKAMREQLPQPTLFHTQDGDTKRFLYLTIFQRADRKHARGNWVQVDLQQAEQLVSDLQTRIADIRRGDL